MCQCVWMQGTDPLGPPASEVAFGGSQQVCMKSHLDYYMFPLVHYCCCYCFGEDEKWMLISGVQIVDDVCGYYLCCACL
jgi:hypothetical protein